MWGELRIYPAELATKFTSRLKTFSDMQNLKNVPLMNPFLGSSWMTSYTENNGMNQGEEQQGSRIRESGDVLRQKLHCGTRHSPTEQLQDEALQRGCFQEKQRP